MPFKIHLLIVSFIIVTVFIMWQMLDPNSIRPDSTNSQLNTQNIIINHASYGLNCRQNNNATQTVQDNVLKIIAQKCNGLQACTILLDSADLGTDPIPDCKPKSLEVEYRCFSYDRPRHAKANSDSIQLKCSNEKN